MSCTKRMKASYQIVTLDNGDREVKVTITLEGKVLRTHYYKCPHEGSFSCDCISQPVQVFNVTNNGIAPHRFTPESAREYCKKNMTIEDVI